MSKTKKVKDKVNYHPITFRLYPNKEQEIMLYKTVGCCRYVYNLNLFRKKTAYSMLKENLYLEDLIKTLPVDKKREETLWLAEVDSTALQQSIKDLFVAYKNFFEGNAKFPRFHRKGKKESFRVVMANQIDVVASSIKIGKLGWIHAKGNFNQYQGESIQSVTVRRESNGNWYCSVLIKREGTGLIPDHKFKFSSCGIDVGIAKPLTVFNKRSVNPLPKGRWIRSIFR